MLGLAITIDWLKSFFLSFIRMMMIIYLIIKWNELENKMLNYFFEFIFDLIDCALDVYRGFSKNCVINPKTVIQFRLFTHHTYYCGYKNRSVTLKQSLIKIIWNRNFQAFILNVKRIQYYAINYVHSHILCFTIRPSAITRALGRMLRI